MAYDRPQSPRPFLEVQDEVHRLFQELIHQPWGIWSSSATTGWQPSCDVAETTEAIIVEVDLPGVERQDVHIAVEGDMLRISGERHAIVEHQERRYSQTERSYGCFEWHLRLPASVDREGIRAEFHAVDSRIMFRARRG